MNVDDDANDQPIVWHTTDPNIAGRQIANPLTADATPDDDIFALMPPPEPRCLIWLFVAPKHVRTAASITAISRAQCL
jgi:hypothetical protein